MIDTESALRGARYLEQGDDFREAMAILLLVESHSRLSDLAREAYHLGLSNSRAALVDELVTRYK
jgi:hypothetical protein